MRVAAGVREIFQSGPNRRAWWGDAGLGALTETMEGSDTAGRAMFRLEACVRGGAARSARVRVRAGTAENLARLGRTTVEDRRAVGSRAVARAAAREGSDGPRRGEHETESRACHRGPPRPRGRHVARSAARQAAPPSGSLPRAESRESAHAGVKKMGGVRGARVRTLEAALERGPGGWRRLGWRRGHGGHGGRHLTTYNDKQRRAHD